MLVAEVDIPEVTDVDGLSDRLAAVGADLGVGVVLRPQETDVL